MPKYTFFTKNTLAIGCGYFVIFVTSHGIAALAIPFYQMTLGVEPIVLAAILTIPVLISAIASSSIGRLVEKAAFVKNGRRYVVFISGWLCAIMYGAMWSIKPSLGYKAMVVYLTLTASAFFLCATFLCISVKCFAYEESDKPTKIISVMGLGTFFEKVGSIFYFWLFPIAQSSIFPNIFQGVLFVGWGVAIFTIGLLSSVVSVFARAASVKITLKDSLKKDATCFPKEYNPLIVPILWITFIQTGLVGLCISLDYYVLVYYVSFGDIQSGAFWKAVVSSEYAIIGLISIPIVVYVSKIYGKKNALLLILVLNAANSVLKWFIYTPGNEQFLIIDALTGVWVWTAMGVIIPSMLADTCYLIKDKHGYLFNSYVVAKHNWAQNLGAVVAVLGSGLLLSVSDFDATKPGHQTQSTLIIFRLVLSYGSLLFSLISIYILYNYKFERR